jgi:hypothetical protein
MGILFNSIHWQNNKAIEVEDYKSVVTTTEPGNDTETPACTTLISPFLSS